MRLFFVTSSTGCTCCSNENRIFGPFTTIEAALAERDHNAQGTLFASQYSKHGRHSIGYTDDAEEISNDRVIIEDRVLKIAPEAFDHELGHPDEWYLDLTYMPEHSLNT